MKERPQSIKVDITKMPNPNARGYQHKFMAIGLSQNFDVIDDQPVLVKGHPEVSDKNLSQTAEYAKSIANIKGVTQFSIQSGAVSIFKAKDADWSDIEMKVLNAIAERFGKEEVEIGRNSHYGDVISQ